MIGGAYGNIVDRFLNGFVTEFFQLHYKHQYYFLIFNVADLLVYIGIILIIIQAKDFQEIFEDIFKKTELQTE
jgi:signal peptidase II